jgi:hypothetical protein
VNDLFLAALFRAMDDWFAVHRPAARQAYLRIMVPINLRSHDDREMPAANVVSMVNLDRRPARYRDGRQLLKSLSREMAVVKRCRLGITLHHLVSLFRYLGKLAWLVSEGRCLSTCVLSNLGEPAVLTANVPEEASNQPLVLTALNFLPPIRPLTAAAFGVVTFRGCVGVALHYDCLLPKAQAAELLERFVLQMEQATSDQMVR